MKILYHLTSPAPSIPDADAVFQDVRWLQEEFGGDFNSLYPLKSFISYYPRSLYGIHCLTDLLKMDKVVDVHHVFFTDLYIFPTLRVLKKPVIYSVIAGLQGSRKPELPPNAHVVINNERDKEKLRSWNISAYTLIRPGIDVSRFTPSYRPVENEFVLMAGSAPWVKAQFKQKGFDALFDAVSRMPRVRLICLWRGLLYDEAMKRIADHGIADRVEIINKKVNVKNVLDHVHAAIVLADDPSVVKAYPHSLLEALASGKPAIINAGIPMADYVARHRCGYVIDTISPDSICDAISKLANDYDHYVKNALHVGKKDFSLETLVSSYRDLYESVVKSSKYA